MKFPSIYFSCNTTLNFLILFKNPLNSSTVTSFTSNSNGESTLPEPVIGVTTLVSIILAINSITFSLYSSIFIVALSDLLLPSVVVAVIVTSPFALAITLTSFPLYVTLYSPEAFISTVFSTTSILVISPSSLSVAVTPLNGSKLSPTFITLSVAFITGGSFTVITIVFIELAPSVSVTLYVT